MKRTCVPLALPSTNMGTPVLSSKRRRQESEFFIKGNDVGRFTRINMKRKTLSFSPMPKVHEFEKNSPACRRLEVRSSDVEKLDQETVFRELSLRGFKVKEVSDVCSAHRVALNACFADEFKKELAKYDIPNSGDLTTVKDKMELLNILLRRARVNSICASTLERPVFMKRAELIKELKKRKVIFDSEGNTIARKLSFSDEGSFAGVPRKNLVTYLETALLKESTGLKIPGYDFGKTLVTSSDIVEYKCWITYGEGAENVVSEQEMKEAAKQVDVVLKKTFRNSFIKIIEQELVLRGVDFPEHSNAEATERIGELFNILYSSKKWKDDYEELLEDDVVDANAVIPFEVMQSPHACKAVKA